MKKLNGNVYFASKDVVYILNSLIGTLGDKEFVAKQTSLNRSIIEKAINTFKNELLYTLTTECAIKFNLIECIYTEIMYPANNLLSPVVYNQMPYHEITQLDMRKCENWYFNYGLSLAIAEFEKM